MKNCDFASNAPAAPGGGGGQVVDGYTIYGAAGTLRVRQGLRGGGLMVDKELIIGGFAGAEGVGWENIGGDM